MRRTGIVLALLFALPISSQVYRTDEPIKISSGSAMQSMTPAEYQKFADGAKGMSIFIPIRHLPTELSSGYCMGYNFVFGSMNHGWILDRDPKGYKLFLDLKGDGDLSDSKPLRFRDEGGVPRLGVPMKDGTSKWIARIELVQNPDRPPGVRFDLASSRSGEIVLRNHKVRFRLSDSSGRYTATCRGTLCC